MGIMFSVLTFLLMGESLLVEICSHALLSGILSYFSLHKSFPLAAHFTLVYRTLRTVVPHNTQYPLSNNPTLKFERASKLVE
jgi:hypothetical protein